jgi:putative ATP-dependent endonuclease of the OLD family
MRIAVLTIRNFRGIREGRVVFGKHTVLVGPNSSGKTTVIEALTTLFGRDRLIRTLTEHDFFGSDPGPADRIQVVATIVGFSPNKLEDHLEWFRPDRAVPKWYDASTGQLYPDKKDEHQLLATQIGFAARFDSDSLEVETVRYFHDDDSTTDPFSDEQHCVSVPLKLIKELGFFLVPANRAWDRMISFDSELFRRVLAQAGGLPAEAVRNERAKLWKPEHPLEKDTNLKSLVDSVNKELAGLFNRNPELRLRITATDSNSVLESITPHFEFPGGPPVPSRRQGMGVLSLQSIILLLQLAQLRASQNKSFCLALEEPELHVPPGLQRRLIHRVHALSTQTIVSTHSPLVASHSEPTNVLMLQNDNGKLTANALSNTGITRSSSNSIRKLLQINRPDTITALMHEAVLVPEGRTEFDLLRLLATAVEMHDKELLPDRSLFGTKVGIVPTHDAAVVATFSALRNVHSNVVALVDGDEAGGDYLNALLALESPPKIVIRWGPTKRIEHTLCWIISAAPDIVSFLQPWLPGEPGSVADILDFLSRPSSAGGVKADLVAYEGIVSVLTENEACLNRMSSLLSEVAALCCGQGESGMLFKKDGTSTTRTTVFTFRE